MGFKLSDDKEKSFSGAQYQMANLFSFPFEVEISKLIDDADINMVYSMEHKMGCINWKSKIKSHYETTEIHFSAKVEYYEDDITLRYCPQCFLLHTTTTMVVVLALCCDEDDNEFGPTLRANNVNKKTFFWPWIGTIF